MSAALIITGGSGLVAWVAVGAAGAVAGGAGARGAAGAGFAAVDVEAAGAGSLVNSLNVKSK